jgi:hypothetical protein
MLAVVPFGTDPVTRVEDAFLAGALAAIVAMAVELALQERSGQRGSADDVLEAITDLPLEP